MATSLPVITFHAIDDSSSVIACPPDTLERGLAALREAGHGAVALHEALGCVAQRLPFPDRSFAITFDDGYESVYRRAFPILREYGWSATVYLAVGAHGSTRTACERLPSLHGRPMLSWAQIREMRDGGIAFGAHSLTHSDLTRFSSTRVKDEVRGSKSIIEDALGTAVTSFAYPFGRYDRRCRDIVRAHFASACADTLGLLHARSDPYALERVDAYYLRTRTRFAVMPTRWFPLYVRACALPRAVRRAVQPRVAVSTRGA